MAAHGRVTRYAANFERNLQEMRRFLAEAEAAPAFGDLAKNLFDTVLPNIVRFPEIGRDFLARIPQSEEGRILWGSVQAMVRNIREYIAGDYLVLYVVDDDAVTLLSIKHHGQLSFDLKVHWS